jgi:hypothetical protein
MTAATETLVPAALGDRCGDPGTSTIRLSGSPSAILESMTRAEALNIATSTIADECLTLCSHSEAAASSGTN